MRVVILENIRSLHNVGAIFRSADGAGWDKVYLCGYTGAPPDRRIEKVSLGAENSMEWEQVESVTKLCKKLATDGFEIVGLELAPNAEDIFNVETPKKNLALVLGNEVDGISPEALEMCQRCVQIPMLGEKESLNVSVAAGIAFYALSQR